MKTARYALCILTLLVVALPLATEAQVRLRLNVGFTGGELHGYYTRLSGYYGVPYGDIRYIHMSGIRDRDIPVIVFLKTHSPYSYRHIIGLRLNGATWMQLFTWCGIPREMYGYGIERNGPPYGNANGHYRHGKGRWKVGSVLTDEEIVGCVDRYYAREYNGDRYGTDNFNAGGGYRPGYGRIILGEDSDGR